MPGEVKDGARAAGVLLRGRGRPTQLPQYEPVIRRFVMNDLEAYDLGRPAVAWHPRVRTALCRRIHVAEEKHVVRILTDPVSTEPGVRLT